MVHRVDVGPGSGGHEVAVLARPTPRQPRTVVTAELFGRLAEAPGEEARRRVRERIVLANAGVARSLAHRYRNRGIDIDDLEQTAYLTLVVSVRRFDPAQGRDFLSFAVPCIVGELRRHFRDQGWTIRVPRRIQEVQRLIERADGPALDDHRFGRATVSELAERLDLTAPEVEAALTARGCFTPASLDLITLDRVEMRLADRLHAGRDTDTSEAAEARAMLARAWTSLRPRDQQILALRYLHDRTQQAIATDLGISQAQVSRILTRLLAQLRRQLSGAADADQTTG